MSYVKERKRTKERREREGRGEEEEREKKKNSRRASVLRVVDSPSSGLSDSFLLARGLSGKTSEGPDILPQWRDVPPRL